MTGIGQDRNRETGSSSTVWASYSTHIIFLVIAVVNGIGTIVYRSLEGWGWVDSFYFSVITLTTVGYGDLAPTTAASKLFTAFYVVTGISLLGAALNEVLKRRGQHMRARLSRRRASRGGADEELS